MTAILLLALLGSENDLIGLSERVTILEQRVAALEADKCECLPEQAVNVNSENSIYPSVTYHQKASGELVMRTCDGDGCKEVTLGYFSGRVVGYGGMPVESAVNMPVQSPQEFRGIVPTVGRMMFGNCATCRQ